MASSLPNPRAPRARPVHYHEGMMKKRGPGETGYKKFWTGLLGNSLYFYNHHRDMQYVDVICLDDFVSLVDDNSRSMVSTEAKMTLQMKDRTVHLKVDSPEHREMWKGFILTVTELKVPTGLSLLPGPRQMMLEVLKKEQIRRAELESQYDDAKDEEMLPCYYNVTRLEAQDMLTKHPEYGNLLLRPSQDNTGISVTTYQKCNGQNVIKHYKVGQSNGAYVIEVETPVSCNSLTDIMNYFVEKTCGALVPFRMQEQDIYEDHLDFVSTNVENGESFITNAVSRESSRPADARGSTNTQFGTRQPPLIPAFRTPEDEDEKEDDEDSSDEHEYMNDPDRNSSSIPAFSPQVLVTPPMTLPRTVQPPVPVSTTADKDSYSRSALSPQVPAAPHMTFPRTAQPSAPVSTTAEDIPRRSTSLGSGNDRPMPTRMPPAPPRQVRRSQEKAGIEEELERALRLRRNQC